MHETITLIHQFENESLEESNTKERFPQDLLDLVSEGYAEACSDSDFTITGKCRPINKTPWGDTITVQTFDADETTSPKLKTHLEMTYPLTSVGDSSDRKRIGSIFGQSIPFAVVDSGSNTIKIRVNRSGTSIRSDVYLRRSGEDRLTGDWDVGDHALVNTKDVTIRNSDGSQRSLAGGVVRSFTALHEDRVTKHKCPSGFTPNINVSVKGLFHFTDANQFTSTGAVTAYASSVNTYWEIRLEYYALMQGDAGWQKLNDGEVKVDLTCD
ncbi:hypothetical protein [uncultured Shewanella sp.]|uniref:hypothetical protein n=1 Tax=uncultured Shewanella sp. TaxID=173975 RepID=UPI002628C59C|nr:hypothetical protein [uncultured Shewanella sp.]